METRFAMDILAFGIIVVDYRRARELSFANAEPLRLVEQGLELQVGGIPIVALTMQRMGFEVGLMGRVGRDLAGYGLKGFLEREAGIECEAVQAVAAPTSSSCILLSPTQRFIEHCPGASAVWRPGAAELDYTRRRRPKLMAIGYAGLLPQLDADEGREMAAWIEAVRALGTLVALDTHTMPAYAVLNKPVPLTDIFICNREEALGITGLPGADAAELLSNIWDRYPPRTSADFRLLGVAYPEGAQLAYGRGGEFESGWIASPAYGSFMPADLTGAGDYFRSGVYAAAATNPTAFRTGAFDFRQAGQLGHQVAAACLQCRPPPPRC
jgi:sugar/nucleoside kinase (ribokinase family)